ncbi:MAG: aminotransferase class I/II-fold pyridoxal phosphate-dependent enzyme [Collinsella sp.]
MFDAPASFARAIEGPGDVAYLCNPNNPTGRLVDPRVIDAAACRCEQVGALLVVDECFLGFAPDARERSVAARAACSHHVAVLSAFTKLYGMAGLRWGIDAETPNSSRGSRAGRRGPSLGRRGGASPPWKTSNTSAHARYWRASERGFPTGSLGLSVVPSDANFHPHAGEAPSACINKGLVHVRLVFDTVPFLVPRRRAHAQGECPACEGVQPRASGGRCIGRRRTRRTGRRFLQRRYGGRGWPRLGEGGRYPWVGRSPS